MAFLREEMEKDPGSWCRILEQKYEMTNDFKVHRVLKKYILKDGFYFLSGIKKSGKTTLIYSLYDEIKKEEPDRLVYVRNCEPIGDMRVLEDFDPAEPYKNLPNGAILFHDEVHYDIESTMAPNSKEYNEFKKVFSTQRHRVDEKGRAQVIIHISQNTMNFTKALLRYCDGMFFLKTSIIDNLEREEFLPFIQKAESVREQGLNAVFVNENEILQFNYKRSDSVTAKHSLHYKGDKK